ncbi:hypothetical protein Nepgr_001855 [Nepenthes gracilis]|uniref:Uncharacterized protein n=1 Tax=Nepenthes gracilis TaxID=150966 RepID=A0AAD3P5S3_NEPGR|nr:hypothetical protein Nepgr_001855 [Nepenthes gracilis]
MKSSIALLAGKNRLDVNLNDGMKLDDQLHELVDSGENVGVSSCIALNTTVENDLVEKLRCGKIGWYGLEMQKVERCFDLNLGFHNESAVLHAEHEGS